MELAVIGLALLLAAVLKIREYLMRRIFPRGRDRQPKD